MSAAVRTTCSSPRLDRRVPTGPQAKPAPYAAWTLIAFLMALWPGLAMSATLDGASLSAWWGVPFAGILLSIAVFPLVAPAFWHHHFGKIAVAWAVVFLAPFAAAFAPLPHSAR